MAFARKRSIQGALLLLIVVLIIAGVFWVKSALTPSLRYALVWHFYNIGFPDVTIPLTPVQPARPLDSLGNSLKLDFSVQATYGSLKLDTNDPHYACLQGTTPLLYANKAAFSGLYLAVFATCGQISQAPASKAGGLQEQRATDSSAPRFDVVFTFHKPLCSVYTGTRSGEQPSHSICFPSLDGKPGNTPAYVLYWDLQNSSYANQDILLTPITPPRPLSSLSHLLRVNLFVGTLTFATTDPIYQCNVGVPPPLFEDKVAYPALFIVAYHTCVQGKPSNDHSLYAMFTFSTPPCSVDYSGAELCFFFHEEPVQTTPQPKP